MLTSARSGYPPRSSTGQVARFPGESLLAKTDRHEDRTESSDQVNIAGSNQCDTRDLDDFEKVVKSWILVFSIQARVVAQKQKLSDA